MKTMRVRVGRMFDGAGRLVVEESAPSQSFKVVKDPDQEGGFSAGAKFRRNETQLMLIYKSFTPGTLLEDDRHGLGEVVEYRYEVRKNGRGAHTRDVQAILYAGYAGFLLVPAPLDGVASGCFIVRNVVEYGRDIIRCKEDQNDDT